MQSKKSAFTLIELSIVLIIIGLLVSGVVAGKIIINKAKLASARSATKSSPVAQIEDLVLWLDAASAEAVLDDNNNPVDDGDTVASWSDINPQGDRKNHATQTTSNNQPTYQESGFNGLPSIESDGSDDFLELKSLLTLKNDFSLFTALKAEISPANSGMFFGGSNSDIKVGRHNEKHFVRIIKDGSGDNNVSWDIEDNIGTYRLSRESTGKIDVSFNNGTGNRLFSDAAQNGNFTIEDLFRFNHSEQYFKGKIAEVIIYERKLSTSETNAIEDYLKEKWNIS